MNIKECIDTVDNLKPNQYTIKEKVMWLSFIEEIIINDVLKTHEGYDGRYDDFEGYSEDKISVTLIVPSPYDRLYTAYLTMKIDESNGETTRYNNSATLYNTYMMEYKKYYNKTHMPIDVIGGNRHMKPQHKPSVSLSDAEYDNIVKDLTFKLTEYFSNTISPDKLYDIVMKYVQNNVEMLKGKDGRDGVDGKNGHTPAVGVDYFTENDKMEFLNHLQEYISSLALSEGDVTTEMIDDGAVTTAKIDDEAVTTEKIRDGAVTRDKLAPDSVTGGKIKEGSVGSLHIIDKNITTKKLADGAVTLEKLADDAKIINNASGDNLALSDSAESNLHGMRMFGRTEHYTYGYQLFDANDLIGGNANLDGASLTVNKDGSFTITNNKSQNAHFNYTKYIAVKSIFKTGKALSLKVYGATNVEVTLGFSDLGDIGIDGTYISNRTDGQNSFEMTQSVLDNAASLTVLMNGTLDSSASETIKIMLYQDGDGTWEPFTGGKPAPTTEFPCKLESVGDDGGVDVNVHGYQLFDASIVKTVSSGGATVTNNGDGTFTITGSGTLTSNVSSMVELDHSTTMRLLKAGTLKLTTEQGSFPAFCAYLIDREGKAVERLNNAIVGPATSRPITDELLNTEGLRLRVGFYGTVASGGTITPCTIKPMLYQDGDGTWEPYKPIQTLNIPTPNGLPGVPVSSNGNYTDESGQQWVCDEIDYERGVYVQRCGVINEYADEDITTSYISTVGDLTPGAKIIYVLPKPIETPLSADEINAHKELHTHYPHTSIHNSDNAHMAVKYVADTKNYVDNQIKKEVAELTAAILTQ